jgi:transcriptional accessory protein Tex/SPT6
MNNEWINCVGFIRYKQGIGLDITRLHPNLYALAIKIGRDALDTPGDQIDREIMENSYKLKELDLVGYADTL